MAISIFLSGGSQLISINYDLSRQASSEEEAVSMYCPGNPVL